jgi:hypothetical protein
MFNLPKSTSVDKFIPKTAFYNKLNIATSVKEEFVNTIDKITWKNKLSEETLGITKTDDIEEIQIFELILKSKNIPKNVIRTIAKNIPYPILFKIIYKEEFYYSIGLYENKKLVDLYFSEWNDDLNLNFSGINLSLVYEKIVKELIKEQQNEQKFDIIIETSNKKKNLEKEITLLQSKIRSEKQFNKKVELNKQLFQKKTELEEIVNG